MMNPSVVLVVEDFEPVLDLTAEFLEMAGLRVLKAQTYEDAQAILLSDCAIDLLLVDIILPGKTGLALYEETKTVRPDMRVIFMTGYLPDILDSVDYPISVDEVLFKPFDFDDVTHRVFSALQRVEVCSL